jgi:SAM-dependent methyltransferase
VPNPVYTEAFYNLQAESSYRSAVRVLGALFQRWRPGSVVDIGCGVGSWLRVAKELGAHTVLGVDGAYVPREALMIEAACFLAADLGSLPAIGQRFDLALCLEAAEHLPAERAEQLAETLVGFADVVLFSAAIPYQGGHGHVNENWPGYWADKFAAHGYLVYDELRRQIWSDAEVCWWYRQNLLVFVREGVARARFPGWRPAARESLAVVHPEQYLNALYRFPARPKGRRLETDLAYERDVASDVRRAAPNYGKEFSVVAPQWLAARSLEDFRKIPFADMPAVLADAVAPIDRGKARPTHERYEAGAGRAPNFIGIGVRRAATTWLYELLSKHPAVWMPPLKEINYFNVVHIRPGFAWCGSWRQETAAARLRDALINNLRQKPKWLTLWSHLANPGVRDAWYARLFGWAPSGAVTGEITPEYSLLPEAGIRHVHRLNPDMKILVLLREPVSRASSHLNMIRRHSGVRPEMLGVLAQSESVLERGNYPAILDRWYACFPAAQIFVGFQEQLQADPHGFGKRLCEFLGIHTVDSDALARRVHEGEPALQQETVLRELRERYATIRHEMMKRYPETGALWR